MSERGSSQKEIIERHERLMRIMGNMPTPTCPFHMFKVFVAQKLQEPPYRWVGSCGYELVEKYSEVVRIMWIELETVDSVASCVNQIYKEENKPIVKPTTKASLEKAGCRFHNVHEVFVPLLKSLAGDKK